MTVAQHADAAFDTRLLIERAVQRVHAFHGDLVARSLLAEPMGDGTLAPSPRVTGWPYRCRDGSVALTDGALTDGAVAVDVLRDPRFATTPPGPDPEQYTVDFVDDVLRAEADAPEPAAAPDKVADVLRRVLPAELDLVADLVRPAVAVALGDALTVDVPRRERFRQLTEAAGGMLDAAVCAPRLADGHVLRAALRELRDLCGVDAVPAAVIGTELAVNLATNAVLRLVDTPAADPTEAVGRTLFADPPVRLHRLFPRERVDIAGAEVAAGTRVLVLTDDTRRELSGEPSTASAVAAHPRPAPGALDPPLSRAAARRGRRRPPAAPARRLRAPVTRAIVRQPMTVQPVTATDGKVR